MTNSLRLPLLSLLLSVALAVVVIISGQTHGLIPLSELELGALSGTLAFVIFGVQGLISVALEGRELRPGIRLPQLTNPLSLGIVVLSLLLAVIAFTLGFGIVNGWDTSRLGVLAAVGCFVLAALLIFYKEAFLGNEARFDNREDGIPW